jgi:hypothetical protein
VTYVSLRAVFIPAMLPNDRETDGYRIATLCNDQPFVMYDVHSDGSVFAKFTSNINKEGKQTSVQERHDKK